MKQLFKALAAAALAAMLFVTANFALADNAPYGSSGAAQDESYTLDEMLTYAIQDEYAAQAEYNLILENYGAVRPFSNIILAEEKHIDALMPLFETYGATLPVNDAASRAVLPESLQGAYETGVEAEIANIAMYDRFLEENLPDDVRAVFENLQAASENHLQAFERAAGASPQSGTSTGNMHGNSFAHGYNKDI